MDASVRETIARGLQDVRTVRAALEIAVRARGFPEDVELFVPEAHGATTSSEVLDVVSAEIGAKSAYFTIRFKEELGAELGGVRLMLWAAHPGGVREGFRWSCELMLEEPGLQEASRRMREPSIDYPFADYATYAVEFCKDMLN